ncbi:hypothetical protein [Actinomadura litoris]|uniref:hypothetical protein n=1 Tax=Actinomadura litoris TaxID=2678616 RepID=UPI001FA75EE5|nr:hypothetical protein [Actinomadura litoris]
MPGIITRRAVTAATMFVAIAAALPVAASLKAHAEPSTPAVHARGTFYYAYETPRSAFGVTLKDPPNSCHDTTSQDGRQKVEAYAVKNTTDHHAWLFAGSACTGSVKVIKSSGNRIRVRFRSYQFR